MKQENIDNLRTLLTEAIDHQISAGNGLITSSFRRGQNYCPIRCLTGDPLDQGYDGVIAQKLGDDFTDSDLWSFIDGFDGVYQIENLPVTYNILLFLLGQELRVKYHSHILVLK